MQASQTRVVVRITTRKCIVQHFQIEYVSLYDVNVNFGIP